MKFYKKEWSDKTSDDDRKHIATQMASSTKNWVSAPAEAATISAQDDEWDIANII